MRLRFPALAASLAFAVFALAQGTGPVASIQAPEGVTAHAHTSAVATFTISIQAGYHIQSNHPKLDYLIPSEIAITPADGIKATSVGWPKAEDHRFSFSPDPLSVFEGTVKVPVTLATGAAGATTLHGTFHYQACNDQLCRPPVTVPFTVAVTVK